MAIPNDRSHASFHRGKQCLVYEYVSPSSGRFLQYLHEVFKPYWCHVSQCMASSPGSQWSPGCHTSLGLPCFSRLWNSLALVTLEPSTNIIIMFHQFRSHFITHSIDCLVVILISHSYICVQNQNIISLHTGFDWSWKVPKLLPSLQKHQCIYIGHDRPNKNNRVYFSVGSVMLWSDRCCMKHK